MKLEDSEIARLKLSGTVLKVGVEHHDKGSSVWFQTDDLPEPVYISPMEAELFIVSLQAAAAEAKDPS